ncbi:DUF488 domain-containing protein [Corynebacterium comes]|uniref:DUF488 family protein n=1 Tax=Corynebacterium comes TaxID=2675218 RepID=A0A6B8VWA6_9CORY|nr:DUF488 family protein [Corynebacterium comes]QGU03967.1 hypothetical protein CETAM_03445 [Corynebacterium comes]
MIRAVKIHDVLRGDVAVQGRGVLVDRLWPRGVAKADLDCEWLKDVAPSPELRMWFNHDPERWEEFRARYRAELNAGLKAGNADLATLTALADADVTLLFGAADREHNQAIVLAEWLTERVSRR